MPAILHFTVAQTRVVHVSANNPEDAARIAKVAFEKGQTSDNSVRVDDIDTEDELRGIWGNTTSRIEVTSVHIVKEL